MVSNEAIEKRIQQYIDEIESVMEQPYTERAEVLQNIEAHIHDALERKAGDSPTIEDLEVVIAEMDTPDSYGNGSEVQRKGMARGTVVAIVLIAILAMAGVGIRMSCSQSQEPALGDEEKKDLTNDEIGQIAKNAVRTISTCGETDPRVKKALDSLEGLDEVTVVQELATSLGSERNTIRRSALYILWHGNFNAITPAEKGLIELCSHKEEYTRGMAALALGANKIDSSFAALSQMTTEDKSGYARRCGAYGLGLLGQDKAIPALKKALKDSDKHVRNNAEAALTMLEKSESSDDGKVPQAPEMPAHWKVTSDVQVPAAQVKAMEMKLGADLTGVRNTIYDVKGKRVQINVLVTTDPENAEKLMTKLRTMKSDVALLRKGLIIYEFVGQNEALPAIAEGRKHLDSM